MESIARQKEKSEQVGREAIELSKQMRQQGYSEDQISKAIMEQVEKIEQGD